MPFFNAKKLEELQSIAGGDHAFLQKSERRISHSSIGNFLN